MRDRPGTLAAVLALALAPCAKAQVTGNMLFTAVPPCRLVDTRGTAQPQPLSPGVPYAFDVAGTGVAAQGGNTSGCRVPGYAGSPPVLPRVQAVLLNLVAVSPQGAGHLTAWAEGPAPLASVLNYTAGATLANAVVVPLAQDATPGADFQVLAAVSATHLVVDVMGYFTTPRPLAGAGALGAGIWGAGPDPQVFVLCTGPTGVRFGLSEVMVEWPDAPTACPAGYWVCSPEERGTAECDTYRVDTSCDGLSCSGSCVNHGPSGHEGWTSLLRGRFEADLRSESGFSDDEDRCNHMPVWCCTF